MYSTFDKHSHELFKLTACPVKITAANSPIKQIDTLTKAINGYTIQKTNDNCWLLDPYRHNTASIIITLK